MRLGAHVSIAGGLLQALERAKAIGAETIQIFASAPQRWAVRMPEVGEADEFRERCWELKIFPVFLHALYLVNLGSPNPEAVHKSVTALVSYLDVAKRLGAEGVVVHTGSHKGRGLEAVLPQVVDSIMDSLSRSDPSVSLIIENCAGMGNEIGATVPELAMLLNELDQERVKICLDTQHAFAAGYDLRTAEGVESLVSELSQKIGLDRLAVVHANDSKVPVGAGVDRHENIGQGFLGLDAFEHLLCHPAFQDVPFILEVPGFEGNGPDQPNLDLLKGIRDG